MYATEVVDIGEDWIKYNDNYDNKNNDKNTEDDSNVY